MYKHQFDTQENGLTAEDAPAWTLRTEGMPADMQLLLAQYPRETWKTHIGFKEKTEHWLGAHQMFRRLASTVRESTEAFLDGNKDKQDYISRLSHRGGTLVGNLHGHHHWEDHSFFPELSAADSRFDTGLQILEADHTVLNQVLDRFVTDANRTIQRIQRHDARAKDSAGAVHDVSVTIETLLQRHLSDEEELAVPVILHHRLRG